jgi:phosphatidate cytidylyltransferase
MIAVAALAYFSGRLGFGIFITVIALGVAWEFVRLVLKAFEWGSGRIVWCVGGAIYVIVSSISLLQLYWWSPLLALMPVALVIATDVCAYFAGRTFGGPKIAPKISPSKTWSGLLGGMTGAAIVAVLFVTESGQVTDYCWEPNQFCDQSPRWERLIAMIVLGAAVAIIAQAGDFFESWLKRKAGVKDSGKLLPGHGGLFDRVDGLLAVNFVIGILLFVAVG